MQAYRKAIVAFVIGAIMIALNQIGLTQETTLMEAVTVIVTAAAVYIFPNAKTEEV